MDILTLYREWLLALHLIAVIFWMAGMYYLPRLYVYHAQCLETGEPPSMFPLMERRLVRLIINPAMIAAWVFGLALFVQAGHATHIEGWLWVKLLCLFALQINHAFLARWRRHFLSGRPPHSSRFFRFINEIPPLLTIIIIIMVFIRPF